MKVEVISDAFILTPNKEHKNFTETARKIPYGRILFGEQKLIKGKRRGEDFTYKLFLTDNQEFIHLNKIKPMKTTEVYLGADSQQSATIVDIPTEKKLLTPSIIAGTAIGACIGLGYSKHKKFDSKKAIAYTLVGAALGFFGAKYVEKRKGIIIKPSK